MSIISSKLEPVLIDICLKSRTGNLSGLAKPKTEVRDLSELSEHAEPVSNKAYSLLFHAGVLQMCQFSGYEGFAALQQLLMASTADKLSWFAMNETGLLNDDPIIDQNALLALLNISTHHSTIIDTTVTKQPSANARFGFAISPALHTTIEKNFSDLFGSHWEKRMMLACVNAGPNASEPQIVEQLILMLTPMAGEAFAKKCFKDFL
jgi:hypothetical protein